MRLPLPTMRLLDAWLLFALALATAAVAASPKKSRERLVSRCEYKALKVGSDLADAFNAPIGDEGWDDRVFQDYIVENLGFAPFLASGLPGAAGKTSSGAVAAKLQEAGGWQGLAVEQTKYSVLNHKWLYFFGDSTTRQIWASFAAPFQGNNFERNSKEWTRQYCSKQEHRVRHDKHGVFHHEGWRGPCGLNEVTCHVSGYGEGGLLTLDWKHFPYEDYDEWLFGAAGPWSSGFFGDPRRYPHFLIVQLGLHSCWHTHPEGLYTLFNRFNESMLGRHLEGIPRLMSAVRGAVNSQINKAGDDLAALKNVTQVIFMTSGNTGSANGTNMDACISRVNRLVADAAHMYGFAVLERGEIEARLMFKSRHTSNEVLKNEMHLVQPAQNIIASSLLQLVTCLSDGYDLMSNASIVGSHHTAPQQLSPRRTSKHTKPLHVPPPV